MLDNSNAIQVLRPHQKEVIDCIIQSYKSGFDKKVQVVMATGNGKYPDAYSKDPNEKRLGLWARTQRVEYKKGKLTDYKVKKLESLDGWIWKLK
jgi:hypothetical protein